MKVKGQITVFISLILLCMFAMICCLVESARTAGARWYLQTAVSSSLDSVFSQYHRQLWDSYRLLFAEYQDEEGLAQDFTSFLTPYLETENWYPMKVEEVQVEDMRTVTDDHGMYLEEAILDYMKFGVWNLDFQEDSMEELWRLSKEAESVKDIAQRYQGHTKEAFRLEKSLEAISANLARQLQRKERGMSELRDYNGSGFRKEAAGLIRELQQLPRLIDTYQSYADALANNLAKSKEAFEGQKDGLSSGTNELLMEEIRQYESYVALDGEHRKEIEGLLEGIPGQIRHVESVVEKALEVERIIDEWEEDEDDDGPDLESLWKRVRRDFDQFKIAPLSFAHGVADKEKEGWLNQIAQQTREGMLRMVLPPDAVLSEASLDLTDAPTKTEIWSKDARQVTLPKRLLINEYCGEFFPDFLSAKGEEHYEMEYLIGGKGTDSDNLSEAVTSLMNIRQGLNLIHILSDGKKRQEAKGLALVITGGAALTPIVYVAAFFIMTVWALGEALCDLRGLLEGKKVVLIKSEKDWHLDLEGLLALGANGGLTPAGQEQGFSYVSWLKILLIRRDAIEQEYRMMDLMQMNLRSSQPSFRMRRGVYQTKVKTRILGKHVFFSLGFVENLLGSSDPVYGLQAEAERSY